MGHDQLFKQLLREFLEDFLQIVIPEISKHFQYEHTEFLDKEFFTDVPEGEQREVDLLAKIRTKKGRPEIILVHIEIEKTSRTKTAERIWRYYMQLRLRHNLPVVPIVVFLEGGKPDVTWDVYEETLFDREIQKFSFASFGLSGAIAETYLARSEPLSAALAALMRSKKLKKPRLKLSCLIQIAKAPLDDARRFLLLNCVETYLPLDEIQKKQYDTLKKTQAPKEVRKMELTWAERMEAEYKAKYQAEGLLQGKVEGKAEGKAEAILRILKNRKIRVSAKAKQEILSCTDLAQLDHWLDLSLNIPSVKTLLDSKLQ